MAEQDLDVKSSFTLDQFQDGDWYVWDMCRLSGHKLAITAQHKVCGSQTLVDVLESNGKLLYNRLFTNGRSEDPLYVSVLIVKGKEEMLITCCGHAINIIDFKNDTILKSGTLRLGPVRCVTFNRYDHTIMLGLAESCNISILSASDLEFQGSLSCEAHHNQGMLSFITESPSEYPREIATYKERVFVCTYVDRSPGRVVCLNSSGKLLMTYKDVMNTGEHASPWSMFISRSMHVICLSWESHVTIHSLNNGDNGNCLAVFKIGVSATRMIRTENNRIITVDSTTGVFSVFDIKKFNFEGFNCFRSILSDSLSDDDCQKLMKHFRLSTDENFKSSRSLIQHLEELKKINVVDVEEMLTAFKQLKMDIQFNLTTHYKERLHIMVDRAYVELYKLKSKQQDDELIDKRTVETVESEPGDIEAQRRVVLRSTSHELTNQVKGSEELPLQTLSSEAHADEQDEVINCENLTPTSEIQTLREELEKKKQDMLQLQQNNVLLSSEVQTLKRVNKHALPQGKAAPTVKPKPKRRATVPTHKQDSESELKGKFGRLSVAVGEDLTLDDCLKIAHLFAIPPSQIDMLRRISLIETPGNLLLDFIKERNIINMYDVNNLQRVLKFLNLPQTEAKVSTFQDKVERDKYEVNKSDVTFQLQDFGITMDTMNAVSTENIKSNHVHDTETSQEFTAPDRSLLYTEHKIGKEGGIMNISDVIFNIPPDALAEDHIIGLEVINDPKMIVPGEVERYRMTPLIKLEPQLLEFRKSATLQVPHWALIPDTSVHSLTVYAGTQTKQHQLSQDVVTWKEELSCTWKLHHKTCSIDLKHLGYVAINLVNSEIVPKQIMRVVAFVNGLDHRDDDMMITVCFCNDNDAEYKLLLKDHWSKLLLDSYSTVNLCHMTDAKDHQSQHVYISIVCCNNGWDPLPGQQTQQIEVNHVLKASRASCQFRLKKNADTESNVFDIKLQISQGQESNISIQLKAKVRNMLLSEHGLQVLKQFVKSDNKRYVELKAAITELLMKLAAYFELTSREIDQMESDEDRSVNALLDVLHKRKLIMPNKMLYFYEALISMDKSAAAELVLSYINEYAERKERSKKQTPTSATTENTEKEAECSCHKEKEFKDVGIQVSSIKFLQEKSLSKIYIEEADTSEKADQGDANKIQEPEGDDIKGEFVDLKRRFDNLYDHFVTAETKPNIETSPK